MSKKESIKLFEEKKVRTVWDNEQEMWYFSISDIVAVLTDSKDPKQYIKKMKSRDTELKVNWGTICTLVPMTSEDGKRHKEMAASTEGVFRIIQSIPSPKAEPFKQWLALVGKERLDEMSDPELAFERAIDTYRKKGYSEKWIEQRLHAIDVRKQLTAEWDRAGVKNQDYGILTNILTKTWSGKSVKEYKQFKGLKKENLRDNMTNVELALNQLAEVSATAIAQTKNPKGISETQSTVIEGGNIAGNARKELEKTLGHCR